jgi:hypothetical protein
MKIYIRVSAICVSGYLYGLASSHDVSSNSALDSSIGTCAVTSVEVTSCGSFKECFLNRQDFSRLSVVCLAF